MQYIVYKADWENSKIIRILKNKNMAFTLFNIEADKLKGRIYTTERMVIGRIVDDAVDSVKKLKGEALLDRLLELQLFRQFEIMDKDCYL